MVDDLHPIRLWRTDKYLRKNLDALSVLMRKSRKKYGEAINGIQLFEAPISLNPRLARNFTELQGYLYKQSQSSQFLHAFSNFWDKHRQVFQIEENLSTALFNTDIDDVPWDVLKIPHDNFYISFGDYGQSSFLIHDFEYIIDGAYVRHVPKESLLFPNDTLIFTFTARLIFPSYDEAKRLRAIEEFHFAEPVYDYAISGAGCLTIGEAIAKGEAEYLSYCKKMDENLHRAAFQWSEDIGVIPDNERIFPTMDKFLRGREFILSSIPLFFNALFYLTQRPEAREERFPKTTPLEDVQKLAKTTNEEIRKSVLSSLARKGFSKVVFVRDPEVENLGPSLPTEREVRAHWRRGHWRNQSYGKGNLLKKWIWILPILVKKGEDLTLGTIHQVPHMEN